MKSISKILFVLSIAVSFSSVSISQSVLSPSDLLGIERAGITQLNPDGTELIYQVYTPKDPNDKPGGYEREYYRMDIATKQSKPLFGDNIVGSSPQYSSDGNHIAFLYQKGDDKRQIWVMPVSGSDTIQVTNCMDNISSFKWIPGQNGFAYIIREPETPREKELKERGYDFIFYEENLKNNQLFVVDFSENFKAREPKQLLKGTHIWDFGFSKDGKLMAFSTSEKNLIDYRYMFRKIKIMDLATQNIIKEVDNVGKLGNYVFNEDGTVLAFASALNINDHAVSQAFTYSLENNTITNHTPENFRGHVSWVGWKSNKELLLYAGEGVYPTLSAISLKNNKRKVLLNAEESGIIFGTPLYASNGKEYVFTGSTPTDPSNIYLWKGKGELEKLTDFNPGLKDLELGEQEVITYRARDGKEIEGVLIKPVGYNPDEKYPLILYVHGGPESHHDNGWLSRYSTPGQVMAGKGYLVAYLNYRASTGYGVDFAMEGFMDPAGKEFDDLADGIDYLVKEKGADKNRVGMAGGSYGGYASAWFATYYTDYVKAVCMFVGISNVISKRGTTDIAYEELLVHSGKPLEDQWQMNLERSPIYWANQSKTATLIYGGAADPRVNPEQSLQLYRRMKMNDHPAVRLVQYPGEGHGNRNQVGQIDVLIRQIDWLDWYVKDLKPLDGPMPPLDISDKYGLDWEY